MFPSLPQLLASVEHDFGQLQDRSPLIRYRPEATQGQEEVWLTVTVDPQINMQKWNLKKKGLNSNFLSDDGADFM